jgi:predicted amidophosphoribosyltransferase
MALERVSRRCPADEVVPALRRVDTACTVRRAVVGGLRELLGLVLPVQCPGCGRWDETLCPSCAAPWHQEPTRCESGAPRLDRWGRQALPVWAVAAYAGPVRETVVAWKDRGRRDLGRALTASVRAAGGHLASPLGSALAGDPLWVVPVPSRAASVRRRGGDLVGGLARAGADGLRSGGVDAEVASVLRLRGTRRDQVGLGARARGRNLAGAFTTRPDVSGRWALVVDDVLTTGSTLAAAVAALETSGAGVLGALVLAATPAPTGDLGLFPRGPRAG